MRKLLYVLGTALTAVFVLPAAAQEKRSGKLGEYDEIIIKQKEGDKNAKVTIEIKDGEVLVDGKKLDDYQNGDLIIKRRHNTPRNGNIDAMPFVFNGDDDRDLNITGNKAVLGVITEKKEAAGTTVVEVAEGSAADKAGLKTGDVITSVDGKKIIEPQELYEYMSNKEPGDKITVTYKRKGKESKAMATLGKRTDSAPRIFNFPPRPGNEYRFREDMPPFGGFAPNMRGGGRTRLGLSVQDTEEGNGAKVLSVTEGSPAEKAGFLKNDLVTEIAGKPVKSAADVAQAYRGQDGSSISAQVQRNGKTATITIKVPKRLNTENL